MKSWAQNGRKTPPFWAQNGGWLVSKGSQINVNFAGSWSGRWESNPRPKLGKLLYCHCTTPARFFDCTCELSVGPDFRLIHGIKREQHIGIRRAQVSWLERLPVTAEAAGSSTFNDIEEHGTVSHWKYTIGSAIVYRNVYREGLLTCSPKFSPAKT